MSFTKEVKDNKGYVTIEGPTSIYEAVILWEAWKECFETSESIVVDLSGVTDCDITGVQLLLSARITAEATGKVFEVNSVSPVVAEALAATGLNPEI